MAHDTDIYLFFLLTFSVTLLTPVKSSKTNSLLAPYLETSALDTWWFISLIQRFSRFPIAFNLLLDDAGIINE